MSDTRPLPPPDPWRSRSIFHNPHANRRSVVLAALFLVGLIAAVTAALVAVTNRSPSIDIQTDIRRVEYQCGSAATAGMGATTPYIQDGKNYYPKYWATGLIAVVDRRTGHAECYE